MRLTLRVWYYRALHFVEQFKDEAPACCGTCRSCVAATAVGASGLVISSVRHGELRLHRRGRETPAA